MKGIRKENFTTAVIAFVLTLILYSLVDQDRRDIQTVVIPIELPALAEDQMLLSTLPEVSLTVEGRRSVLRRWTTEERPTIKITELDEGENDVVLRDADVRLPTGTSLRSIVPATVRVVVETRQLREVSVRANLRGMPPEGYELGEVSVSPARMSVSGPRSSLEGLDSVFTQTISLEGQRESFTREVTLSLHRPFLSQVGDDAIVVSVEISVEEETRTLEPVIIELVGAALREATLDRTELRVRISGPRSVVEGLDASDVFAVVTPDQLDSDEPGTYLVEPAVRNLPGGVEVVDVQPREVRVRLPEPDPDSPESESSGDEESESDQEEQ